MFGQGCAGVVVDVPLDDEDDGDDEDVGVVLLLVAALATA
jgi:hypothetical protein